MLVGLLFWCESMQGGIYLPSRLCDCETQPRRLFGPLHRNFGKDNHPHTPYESGIPRCKTPSRLVIVTHHNIDRNSFMSINRPGHVFLELQSRCPRTDCLVTTSLRHLNNSLIAPRTNCSVASDHGPTS